jgi:GntR family transcriptional regulator
MNTVELISREDHQKLYLQVYGIMKKKIEANEWQIGSQIPTETNLCEMFNVSRATVRTAILELVRQGYLKRQQGKGTFVYRTTVTEGFLMHTNLKEHLLDYSDEPTSEVLVRTVMMPIDDIDTKLNISPDKHIIYIKKTWRIHDEPVILQEIYVPHFICPLLLEDDIDQQPISQLFEQKYGIQITRVKNYVDIQHVTEDQSTILGAKGFPSLCLTQEFYSGETIVAYSVSMHNPNSFPLYLDLIRNV